MDGRNAEEILKDFIGHGIIAEVFAKKDTTTIFKGMIVKISCNCIYIKNEEEYLEMFRYEDIRHFKTFYPSEEREKEINN